MSGKVTSRRPYLIRAMHEWMTDNAQTPHLVVDALHEGVDVPRAHVRDGRIILNVSWQATQGLRLGNDAVEFSARFSGVPCQVRIPVRAVVGIYSRESGQGMVFQEDADGDHTPPSAPSPEEPRKPKLRVIK